MEISVPLNLDSGFIRRQCPSCDRQFKWHYGPTDERPADAVDPALYHCPYCGMRAAPDEWWTRDQASYIGEAAISPAIGAIQDELGEVFRGFKSKNVKVSFKAEPEPLPPSPPPEPADMQEIQPPCHPWEPIKILDDWHEALHCIVCGDLYSV